MSITTLGQHHFTEVILQILQCHNLYPELWWLGSSGAWWASLSRPCWTGRESHSWTWTWRCLWSSCGASPEVPARGWSWDLAAWKLRLRYWGLLGWARDYFWNVVSWQDIYFLSDKDNFLLLTSLLPAPFPNQRNISFLVKVSKTPPLLRLTRLIMMRSKPDYVEFVLL